MISATLPQLWRASLRSVGQFGSDHEPPRSAQASARGGSVVEVGLPQAGGKSAAADRRSGLAFRLVL